MPGSKLPMLEMVIPPLIGNPYSGYINPYHKVDGHPLLHGNNGSLDPSTYIPAPLTGRSRSEAKIPLVGVDNLPEVTGI